MTSNYRHTANSVDTDLFVWTNDSYDDYDDNNTTLTDPNYSFDYNSTPWFAPIVAGVALCLVAVAYAWMRSGNRPNNANAGEGDVEDGTFASKLAKMTPEERMEIYGEAFDKNQNQIVLEASRIHTGNPNKIAGDVEDDQEEIADDDRSTYLALEGARRYRRSTKQSLSVLHQLGASFHRRISDLSVGESMRMDVSRNRVDVSRSRRARKSSIVHPRSSTCSAVPGDIETGAADNSPTKCKPVETNIVSGNCVICFEDMEAGDTIVWSETKTCPHVYHKDCMVAFLAHKKQSAKELELDENPCPMCRQKFVTVCCQVATTPTSPIAEETSNSSDGSTSSENPSPQTLEN